MGGRLRVGPSVRLRAGQQRVRGRPSSAEIRAEHDNLIAVLRRAIDRDDAAEAVVVFSVLSQAWFVRGAFSEFLAFGPVVLALLETA